MTTMLIPPRTPRPPGPLRQNQIAFLLRWGLTNKEIARTTGITEATVKVQVKTICHKLGVTNRIQIAIAACKHWGFPDERKGTPKNEEELDALLFGSQESPTPPTEEWSTHFWNLGHHLDAD